jgi:hypothetical protein
MIGFCVLTVKYRTLLSSIRKTAPGKHLYYRKPFKGDHQGGFIQQSREQDKISFLIFTGRAISRNVPVKYEPYCLQECRSFWFISVNDPRIQGGLIESIPVPRNWFYFPIPVMDDELQGIA